MNRTKYKVVSIFLVSTMVIATICSFATFYAHADDDHTNVSQEQIQKVNEQGKKNDALNIVSNSSLTTETQKVTNSNSTDQTSTNDAQLQNESTSSSSDTTAEKSSSESINPYKYKTQLAARAGSNNVLIDGTWLTPRDGDVWLSNWQYYTRTARDGTVYVLLEKYTGSASSSITIPGLIPTSKGNKRVVINSLNPNSDDYVFSNKLNQLQTIKFVDSNWNGNIYKVGIAQNTGCALAFRFATNLRTVDLSGLDFSSPTTDYTNQITDMSYMFQGCSNLTRVSFPNTGGTNNIRNASYMFLNCTSLSERGLVNINNFFSNNLQLTTGMFSNTALTSAPNIKMVNVTDMSCMFDNCSNLTSFDTSKLYNFRISSVRKMDYLFRNCPNLTLINFSQLLDTSALMNQQISTTNLFLTSVNKPLILIVPEWQFTPTYLRFNNYNFGGDNRTINQYPMLNANGGTFSSSNNKETLNYFTSCAVNNTQLDMNTFNNWLTKQVPNKTGTTFLRWNTNMNTTAQNVLDLVNQRAVYSAEWIQMPNTATDNRVLNTQEPLAIAYLPNVFTTGPQPIPLQNSGQQAIPFVKNTTLNIGIRDQRKSNTDWNLTAQLIGNPSNLPDDAYLQINNSATTLNTNNGTVYNPSIDLKPVTNPVGTPNAKITATPTTIMSKNSSTELNGVYDLNLGNISLVLPNSQNVAVGNYSATVSWNLVTAP